MFCSNLGDSLAVYIPLGHHTSAFFETGRFVWLSEEHRAGLKSEV